MNERIRELAEQAGINQDQDEDGTRFLSMPESSWAKFVQLIVESVLDEVKERAYYTGDRDWSDEVDRPWIQLEFGYGSLADAQKGIFK